MLASENCDEEDNAKPKRVLLVGGLVRKM